MKFFNLNFNLKGSKTKFRKPQITRYGYIFSDKPETPPKIVLYKPKNIRVCKTNKTIKKTSKLK